MSDEARPLRPGESVSRRDLLKLMPAAGIVAAGGALLSPRTSATREVRGVCRACLARCGVKGTLRGDRLVRVEGDPDSNTGGFICLHGMAIREIVHSPARLRRPLKRIDGSMHEITWNQALDEIGERLIATRNEFGPESLAVHAGWGLVSHPLQGFLLRFCQAFGTPNFSTVESLCQAGLRMGEQLTVGSRSVADANRSRTLVVWGANPTVSNPLFARVVTAAAWPGRNLLVVDPVRTEIAARASMHLRIRPGTDSALALGMMHVLVHEGLYDRGYVDRYVLGFDRLVERLEGYGPERVARITSVSMQEIRRAARLIANEGPSSFWTGLGIEHHEGGLQAVRAVTILAALCGDIGVPGGSKLQTSPRSRVDGEPLPFLHRLSTPRPVPPPVTVPPIGYEEFPLFEIFNRQAQANLLARAILEDRPYPIRALILFASNPLSTSPDSERMRRAAEKLPLMVTVDPFLTASGEQSDYVLPAASFAEGEPVERRTAATVDGPMISERHDSRTDWDILRGLAKSADLERYFPWETLEEAQRQPQERYMPARRTLRAKRLGGATPVFPTASGKLEIFSETLERFGYDPLPGWQAPAERPEATGGSYPLILVSGPRTRAYIGSQFRQIPSVVRKMPRPSARMHPETASRNEVADGDRVTIVGPAGSIDMRAEVTVDVHPDCVVIPVGWSEANANLLSDDRRLDPVTGFPAFRSGVCRVERASSAARDQPATPIGSGSDS